MEDYNKRDEICRRCRGYLYDPSKNWEPGGMCCCRGGHSAILSTTVLPLDGTYSVKTLKGAERDECLQSLAGVPHYVGHPDTKAIVEALGAVQAPTKLFRGLDVGESCVCVPIKQSLSTRPPWIRFTVHQAIEELGTLDVRVLTRLA